MTTTEHHDPALAHGNLHVEQALAITTALDHLDDDQATLTPAVTEADRDRAEAHLLAQAADHDAHALTNRNRTTTLTSVAGLPAAHGHHRRI